jgi:hypothetical protein
MSCVLAFNGKGVVTLYPIGVKNLPIGRHRRPASRSAFAAVLATALAALTACTAIPPALDDPAEPEPDYGRIVAQNVNATFANAHKLSRVEISGLRRVFYTRGWSWIACLRFEADNHLRTHAFFIQGNRVIESRYAVQSDECGAQQYAPFDMASGAAVPPAPTWFEPLY